MPELPTPHGDKLRALLANTKLPVSDQPRVENAIKKYEAWLDQLRLAQTKAGPTVDEMVALLNDYRTFIDIDLIFDSTDDFLYRQKGQLKLDNSVVEEFLPILITTILANEFQALDLSFGPTTCFSGLRFESSLPIVRPGGGMTLRSKDQDFVIGRKLYLRASHESDFHEAITQETHIAYVAAECKTNLDKTMFQEAAATAVDVKTVVPGAKYYLLCEWLDMTPISTSTTAIDEILILRKSKRLASNIREQFNTSAGRKRNRDLFVRHLESHPLAPETFSRFVNHIRGLLHEETEATALQRGYF